MRDAFDFVSDITLLTYICISGVGEPVFRLSSERNLLSINSTNI